MRIALAGKKCVGKTTLADYLVKEHDYQRYSFAGKLKEQTAKLIRFLVSQGWVPPPGYDFTSKDRAMLQFVGTEMFRDVNMDIWADYLMNQISPVGHIVIDDLRFDNEIEICKMNYFVTIEIVCDESIRQDRERRLYGKIEGNEHESENGITTGCNYTIDGTVSIPDMIEQLNVITQHYM